MLGRLVEVGKRSVGQPTPAAKVNEAALGDDEVGVDRHAKVRPPIADHDARPVARSRPVRALAVACADPTVATRVGKRQAPAIAALPLQPVCEERKRKPLALQDGSHEAIETVRDDSHNHALPSAKAHERMKAGIDPHIANLVVELLGRRAQQGHLAAHALARRYPPGLPRVLDVPPGRGGEPLQKPVGGVVGRHRAIEVDEHPIPRPGARRRASRAAWVNAVLTWCVLCSAILQGTATRSRSAG